MTDIKQIANNQLLAQMRVMAAQVNNQGTISPANTSVDSSNGFGNMLKNAIESVNETQMTAKDLKVAYTQKKPGVDLADVMLASQKSGLAFEAAVQVRNKLLDAYKEIMSMSV